MHRPSFTADFFGHLENVVMAAHADPQTQEGGRPAVNFIPRATDERAKPWLCKPLIDLKRSMLYMPIPAKRKAELWSKSDCPSAASSMTQPGGHFSGRMRPDMVVTLRRARGHGNKNLGACDSL